MTKHWADDHTPERKVTDPTRGTVMIAAFEGWNDAADAASTAVKHLHHAWQATDLLELDPEEYHDFQVNRPLLTARPDGIRHITWPTTSVASTVVNDGRRIVLVHGVEPSMRWRRFCAELLDIAHHHQVTTIVTLGALLADAPHTRPIPVTATSQDADLQDALNLEPSQYEGPTGIVGVLHNAAHERGFPSIAVWAAVPHYVAHPPSPKATLAILNRIAQLLGEPIPLGELPHDARAWQHGVDELAAQDSEIADYITQLEDAKDAADLPEASGEAIAQAFESYLRHRDDGPQATS